MQKRNNIQRENIFFYYIIKLGFLLKNSKRNFFINVNE